MIQSLFGVGLLLFGTPILIMLGLTFRDALWILLPASITVSMLQLALDRRLDLLAAKSLISWTVPSVGAGLLLILSLSIKIRIDYFIIGILIVSALLRFSTTMRERLAVICHDYRRTMLLMIGFVHGVTNMGGSLLSIYAAAQSSDKYAIRQYVALGYAFFAATQLAVLMFTGASHDYPNPLQYMITAGAIFVCFGRAAFNRLNQHRYAVLLNFFMLGCAALLIGKNFISTH